MSMGAVLNVGFENVEALINKAVYCKYSSSFSFKKLLFRAIEDSLESCLESDYSFNNYFKVASRNFFKK